MTEPISCEVESPRVAPAVLRETEFEKRRGVSNIEVRRGFAQVHISEISGHAMSGRLSALKAIRDAQVSIDFLKLTPSGLSFLVAEEGADAVRKALEGSGFQFTVRGGRSIVLVHAVNMRDEEGLIARIVQTVIGTKVIVDHIGDMHDRLLLVVKDEDAAKVKKRFQDSLIPAEPTR
jgi:aspartokinase